MAAPSAQRVWTSTDGQSWSEVAFPSAFASSLGLLPSAGPGISAGVLVAPPHFPALTLSGTYLFGTDAAADRGAHATFAWFSGALGLCPLSRRRDAYALFACAAIDLTGTSVHSTGFDVPGTDETRIGVAPEVELRGSFRIAGPLRVVASLSGLIPIAPDSFVFVRPDGSESKLFQTSPVAGKAFAGLGIAF